MDHGKILKFVRNKTFYFFFHKQSHFISNSNCKKIKHPERKMFKKKNNKLLPLRSSVCNWTREGNDSFKARHPSGPIPLSQKNKIISYSFFCINNFKWIMVKFWNSWEIKHFIFFFHKQSHFISNSNCKKIKHPERKMFKKKNNKLLLRRFSVCNWTREGNDSFRARHPSGPIPLSQKNKIISYSFFCINNFKWIMVKFWNSWEIKHFIFFFS